MNQDGGHTKGRIPGSRRSMQSYILTYAKLLRQNPLIALGSLQKSPQFLRPQESWRGSCLNSKVLQIHKILKVICSAFSPNYVTNTERLWPMHCLSRVLQKPVNTFPRRLPAEALTRESAHRSNSICCRHKRWEDCTDYVDNHFVWTNCFWTGGHRAQQCSVPDTVPTGPIIKSI